MKVLQKEVLSDVREMRIVKMFIESPLIARKALPGQFVVLMVSPNGERVPLTVVDVLGDAVLIVFQEVGFSTRLLGQLNEGDSLFAFLGPLGHAAHCEDFGKGIFVAGGVGIAEIYPVARKSKQIGNHTTVIVGARSREILFFEDELRATVDHLYVATDDGSAGEKGFTTDILASVLAGGTCDTVYTVGPIPMMRKVAEITRPYSIRTIASLNALMLDGTGMCGGCRVTVGGTVCFACVDGPEFDAHLVDWDELEKRNGVYREKEKHVCRIRGNG